MNTRQQQMTHNVLLTDTATALKPVLRKVLAQNVTSTLQSTGHILCKFFVPFFYPEKNEPRAHDVFPADQKTESWKNSKNH